MSLKPHEIQTVVYIYVLVRSVQSENLVAEREDGKELRSVNLQ